MTQNEVVLNHLRRKSITPVSVKNRDGGICNVARYSLL